MGTRAGEPARAAATVLDAGLLARVDEVLAPCDADRERRYPGEPASRQPVHTVYVPADQVHADVHLAWGAEAAAVLRTHGGDAAVLGDLTGVDPGTVAGLLPRVLAKLASQPVEDLRADLEDGYGQRPDPEEDGDATRAGAALAAVARSAQAPVLVGVRVKSLEPATRARGLRSLDLALASYLGASGDPRRFVTTLPKVTAVAQVEAAGLVLAALEEGHGLAPGTLALELQVETAQAVLGADGTATVARMIHAAGGRCTGLPYGTYDYSAALGVAAAHQALDHPVADHAKAVMAVAAAGTGARVSDGSTNVLPVGPKEQVHAAWALHARLVRRSLERGIYQGWDLHPAQLPTRYLATFAFFAEALPAAAGRLRAYLGARDPGAGAPGAGPQGVLDEPATAQMLAAVAVRALDCGAVDEAEVLDRTGLARAGLDARARRRGGGS